MSSSYTWDEVRQHTSPGDLWLVIDNKVYDVSQWMDEHPGGDFVLLQEAGKDATSAMPMNQNRGRLRTASSWKPIHLP